MLDKALVDDEKRQLVNHWTNIVQSRDMFLLCAKNNSHGDGGICSTKKKGVPYFARREKKCPAAIPSFYPAKAKIKSDYHIVYRMFKIM